MPRKKFHKLFNVPADEKTCDMYVLNKPKKFDRFQSIFLNRLFVFPIGVVVYRVKVGFTYRSITSVFTPIYSVKILPSY